MSIYTKLAVVQNELKAPKNQYNSFGKYKYRSCEDIVEAVKPLCIQHGVALIISDSIVHEGDRYYIKATCTLFDVETGESVSNTAFAREEEAKKGMDSSQISGTASSYARKYALNGLLMIDDSKDADTDAYAGGNADNQPIPEPRADVHTNQMHTPTPTNMDNNSCSKCGAIIKSAKVLDYSLKRYNRPMCYECGRNLA